MTDTAPHTRNGVHVHASFQYVRCDLSPELISHYSTAAQAEAVAAPKAEQAEGVITSQQRRLAQQQCQRQGTLRQLQHQMQSRQR